MTDLTLVLLPGMDGTGVLFKPLIDRLPDQLRPKVVTYPSQQRLSYQELLPLVLESLPQSDPFVLLGESFSGPLAVMIAARAPHGLRALVLCASFVRSPLPEFISPIRHLVRGAFLGMAPKISREWMLLGKYATPELRRLSADAIDQVSPQVLLHRIRSVLRVDVRPELKRCAVPLLYLQGAEDRIIGRRNFADIAEGYPKAQLVTIAAPHFILQTQPAAAAEAITTFCGALHAATA